MRCVTKQELMELLADLSGEYSDIANCWVRVKDAADTIRALADRPEPAQPVAFRWHHKGPEAQWNYGDSPEWAKDYIGKYTVQMLYAAPPSHPAPSEAGAERQERDRE